MEEWASSYIVHTLGLQGEEERCQHREEAPYVELIYNRRREYASAESEGEGEVRGTIPAHPKLPLHEMRADTTSYQRRQRANLTASSTCLNHANHLTSAPI